MMTTLSEWNSVTKKHVPTMAQRRGDGTFQSSKDDNHVRLQWPVDYVKKTEIGDGTFQYSAKLP
jgi:hypothetical protein